jgi:hypothetical protein
LVNEELEQKAKESIVKRADERKALFEKVIHDVKKDNGMGTP